MVDLAERVHGVADAAYGGAAVDGRGLVSSTTIVRGGSRFGQVSVTPSGLFGQREGCAWSGVVPPVFEGSISGMSASSRRRLKRRLMLIDWEQLEGPLGGCVPGCFVTLTYPGKWFPHDWQQWKRDLADFRKRLDRAYPGCAGVWRIGMLPRKSGELQGLIAPHFHMAVWFGGQRVSLGQFRRWLSRAWWQVVGSGDVDHLHSGTNAKRIYRKADNPAGLMLYLVDYLAKDECGDVLTGRVWGDWGEMPQACKREFKVDWVELLRRLRKWGRKSRYLRNLRQTDGLTVFGVSVGLLRGISSELSP